MNTKSSKLDKRSKGGKGKSAKEAFLKKIEACMKIYDYKDEKKLNAESAVDIINKYNTWKKSN